MSKLVVKTKELEDAEPKRLAVLSRKVMLAGMGAIGMAQDEIDAYVKKMVERGEVSEKKARKMLDDVKERRGKAGKHAEMQVGHQIEKVLHRANVPTKHDIEALSAKITTLTHKVEELNAHKTHA